MQPQNNFKGPNPADGLWPTTAARSTLGSIDTDALASIIDLDRHQIDNRAYATRCRDALEANGALVLRGFFRPEAVEAVRAASIPARTDAFFSDAVHNVYLKPPDPDIPDDHPRNRQVVSTKGCITDRQVPLDSPLRTVYDAPRFRRFVEQVVDVDAAYPYADDVSSINVHFADEGRELGWHFDNSSFAVTVLIQAPDDGGHFDYVPGLRRSAVDDDNHDGVAAVLDGAVTPLRLTFDAGDLVLFRGRDALHRVTPVEGPTTRILAVFAYNTEPGIGLSDEAKELFYGVKQPEAVASDGGVVQSGP